VKGLRFRFSVRGLEFKVKGSGCRVKGLWFRGPELGVGSWAFGSRV